MYEMPARELQLPDIGGQTKPVLVLGLGNILMEDEGIGVRVVERLLRQYELPPDVEALDGGTAGMALYEHVVGRQHLIVIDAVKTGRPAGTIVKLENDEVPVFFRNKVSPHQLALSDILAALKISGGGIPAICVIGIEPASLDTSIELSKIVAARLDKLLGLVLAELQRLDCRALRKIETEMA